VGALERVVASIKLLNSTVFTLSACLLAIGAKPATAIDTNGFFRSVQIGFDELGLTRQFFEMYLDDYQRVRLQAGLDYCELKSQHPNVTPEHIGETGARLGYDREFVLEQYVIARSADLYLCPQE
jgi:hypothetical protein